MTCDRRENLVTFFLGDETKSIVSDTWSTDVLASDSEMLDQVNLVAQMQLLETHFQSTLEPGGDTGSDAWSTDVAASDNERLQDVDTDDTGSLARSDDTRSEISAGGDEEIAPPPVTDRQALRHSHHHHHHHRHHRRSNLRPLPQSPKQPLIPQQHGVSAATCSDGSIVMVQTSTSPRAPVPPVDSILEPPRASAPQGRILRLFPSRQPPFISVAQTETVPDTDGDGHCLKIGSVHPLGASPMPPPSSAAAYLATRPDIGCNAMTKTLT
ncbi:hypothetical protein HPB49_009945 [Dermacentor silvarum]|uniref:Uncharacterized protein n=1 Tax=Dermacentor silvarum TaxID=543639 RepID=A0ACB8DYU8_DERSI|nr:hypothetical protein HPB49_009945 [Dermacentor silvarum]